MTQMSKLQKKFEQAMLDKIPNESKDARDIIQDKSDSVNITEILFNARIDGELEVKISFKLPLKQSISRVMANLWLIDNK